MAEASGTDAWSVYQDWSLGRLDFNLAVYARAADEAAFQARNRGNG